MVQVETLSNDQLTAKMSVLHCMMMLHGGELLSRIVACFSLIMRKGEEKKIKSLTKGLDNLHAEVARLSADLNRATILEAENDEEILRLKAAPPGVQGELLSLAASAGFERGLSMHQTKDDFAIVLKNMAHFMHGAQGTLAEASPLVAQTGYAIKPLSVILQLELEKLARPANVPASKDARVSPPFVKESTMTPASESLEFPTNVVPASSVVTLKQNEEWVNVMVDGSDPEITDAAANVKSESIFVQGTSCALDDIVRVTGVGSERASSDPSDVVVALSTGKKGDGSMPSSVADEEATANPFGV
ncbi:hypothetical protein Tco_0899219 [Tanacetum coccineum]